MGLMERIRIIDLRKLPYAVRVRAVHWRKENRKKGLRPNEVQ